MGKRSQTVSGKAEILMKVTQQHILLYFLFLQFTKCFYIRRIEAWEQSAKNQKRAGKRGGLHISKKKRARLRRMRTLRSNTKMCESLLQVLHLITSTLTKSAMRKLSESGLSSCNLLLRIRQWLNEHLLNEPIFTGNF